MLTPTVSSIVHVTSMAISSLPWIRYPGRVLHATPICVEIILRYRQISTARQGRRHRRFTLEECSSCSSCCYRVEVCRCVLRYQVKHANIFVDVSPMSRRNGLSMSWRRFNFFISVIFAHSTSTTIQRRTRTPSTALIRVSHAYCHDMAMAVMAGLDAQNR